MGTRAVLYVLITLAAKSKRCVIIASKIDAF